MAVNDLSRFKNTKLLVFNGHETFGSWQQFPFLKERPSSDQIGVFQVTSKTEGRPDLIANAVYGNSQFDWILIAFNNVYETLNWPRAGDFIEYPLDVVVLPQLI